MSRTAPFSAIVNSISTEPSIAAFSRLARIHRLHRCQQLEFARVDRARKQRLLRDCGVQIATRRRRVRRRIADGSGLLEPGACGLVLLRFQRVPAFGRPSARRDPAAEAPGRRCPDRCPAVSADSIWRCRRRARPGDPVRGVRGRISAIDPLQGRRRAADAARGPARRRGPRCYRGRLATPLARKSAHCRHPAR